MCPDCSSRALDWLFGKDSIMRWFGSCLTLVIALGLTTAVARSDEKKENTAIKPVEKGPELHKQFLQRIKDGPVDVVFFGDSITNGWRGAGKDVWKERFEPLKAANFGIGGDRTQHVLWRMQHGELDGITPKLCMLMIGTNNGKDSAEDVAAGITAIIKEIQKKSPTTKVLLLGIFPLGEKPNPGREKN